MMRWIEEIFIGRLLLNKSVLQFFIGVYKMINDHIETLLLTLSTMTNDRFPSQSSTWIFFLIRNASRLFQWTENPVKFSLRIRKR